MRSIEAIFTGGVFRPLNDVGVAENQRVRLTIESLREPAANKSIQTAQDLMDSDLAGMWANRDDIFRGLDFASRVRAEAESQRGRNHATR